MSHVTSCVAQRFCFAAECEQISSHAPRFGHFVYSYFVLKREQISARAPRLVSFVLIDLARVIGCTDHREVVRSHAVPPVTPCGQCDMQRASARPLSLYFCPAGRDGFYAFPSAEQNLLRCQSRAGLPAAVTDVFSDLDRSPRDQTFGLIPLAPGCHAWTVQHPRSPCPSFDGAPPILVVVSERRKLRSDRPYLLLYFWFYFYSRFP